jgi:hypothetical protein
MAILLGWNTLLSIGVIRIRKLKKDRKHNGQSVQWIKVKQKGHAMIYKRKRKPKGQSGMDNPHTHATLGTRHKTKTNKTKNTTQIYLIFTLKSTMEENWKQNSTGQTWRLHFSNSKLLRSLVWIAFVLVLSISSLYWEQVLE